MILGEIRRRDGTDSRGTSFGQPEHHFAKAAEQSLREKSRGGRRVDQEDQSRARAGLSAENLPTVRRMAINLLNREKTKRRGIKGKRLNASWDHNHLLRFSIFRCAGPNDFPCASLQKELKSKRIVKALADRVRQGFENKPGLAVSGLSPP
jgi:hypothetical protein